MHKINISKNMLRTLYGVGTLLVICCGLTLGVPSRAAWAATMQPPGTCFGHIQGVGDKTGPCSKLFPGLTDNNGNPIDPTKCYDVTSGLSSQNVAEVRCDDTDLPGTSNQSMCDIGSGKTVKCSDCTQDQNPLCDKASAVCKNGKGYCCGKDPQVQVSINLGCKGEGNPILDLIFAIIRFLSIGVGLVITASMVWAGIQYTASRGDPNATSEAIKRLQSNVVALLIFIFAYAILNYVVPGAVLK